MFNPMSQTLTKLAAKVPANMATIVGKAYTSLNGAATPGSFKKNFAQMMMDRNQSKLLTTRNINNARVEAMAQKMGVPHKFDKPFAAIRGAGWD